MLHRTKIALSALAIIAVTVPIGAAFAQVGSSAPVVSGGMLPSPSGNNSQGEPQSANSLPPGFENGTPGMQRRQELQQYRANQAQEQRR